MSFSEQTVPLIPEIPLIYGDHIIDMWLELKEKKAPHWAFPWVGGIALARWTLDNPEVFASAKVLDVGSGTGLNTIAAQRAGAAFVYASDWEQRARDLTQWNVENAGIQDQVAVNNATPLLSEFDIVLLGDVFYESWDLMALADKALENGCLVLVGDGDREYLPRRRLEKLETYLVNGQQLQERQEHKAGTVYRYLKDE